MNIVVPYIKTLGTKKFKEFIQSPFNYNMLDSLDDNSKFKVPILFNEWYGKNMAKWVKFKSGMDEVLEFYSTHYIIRVPHKNINQQLPLPITINDFINDMTRIGISLHWTNWIDENFEPKDYLSEQEIKKYYMDLLSKMDKSHEMLENA